MIPFLAIILLLAAILLLLLTAASAYFFHFAHRRHADNAYLMESDVRRAYRDLVQNGLSYNKSIPHEILSVTSFDGLRLVGTYLPVEHPRGCILCFHGYRSTGMQDFAPMPKFYHALHLSVLIVDQRACGASDGKHITFGIRERQDVLTWAQEMDHRLGGLPLLLDGLSLGATTVMMAADLPLPKSVRGIIADCGFTSPWEILSHCGKQWFHIPEFPLMYILSVVSKLRFGGGYRSCSTLTSLANSTLPLLLLHGAEDDFVPTHMSEENYAAATGYKHKVIIPGAGHGMSYLVDMPKCQRELAEFVDLLLK
ncbi:MAG: alpha/beta hydrolase [Oscillospiraceae bacterium]|nr:alpha/beta hydrolase [Oscillospiraceae bacterium]